MQNLKDRVSWAILIIKGDKLLFKEISDIELSRQLDVSEGTLSAYKKGGGVIKATTIEGFERHYNFNINWLYHGQGEPFPGARKKYPEVCGERVSIVICDPDASYETGEIDPSENFVFIKQVNGKISAGGGMIPDNSVDMRLAFRREWFNKKGNPENMSLIKVIGDSMEPTLLSGDLVLVDHTKTSIPSQGGIYAISMDHEILIKRLQLLYKEGKILVISDNKQYIPQEIDSDKITINGKVIWFARVVEK